MSLPIYKRIKNKMLVEIGSLHANDPIPSERVLAHSYQASRMTVRKAIDELVDEGILYRDAKRGTYVADITTAKKNTLIDTMVNDEVSYRVLYFDVKSYSSFSLQKALDVRPADQVVRMIRIMSIDNVPYAIEEFYVERRSITDEELNNMINWKNFNQFLNEETVVTQRFVPTIVPVQYAKLLNMNLGSPILMVENFFTDRTGGRLAYAKIYHNSEVNPVEITSKINN